MNLRLCQTFMMEVSLHKLKISKVNLTKSVGNWFWSHLLKKSLMEKFIFCAVRLPEYSWAFHMGHFIKSLGSWLMSKIYFKVFIYLLCRNNQFIIIQHYFHLRINSKLIIPLHKICENTGKYW